MYREFICTRKINSWYYLVYTYIKPGIYLDKPPDGLRISPPPVWTHPMARGNSGASAPRAQTQGVHENISNVC